MKTNKQISEVQGADRVVYIQLLEEAQRISGRTLGRLRELRGRFPAALPDGLIEQIERIHTDTPHERRRFPRQRDDDTPMSVAEPADLADWQTAELVDHSAGGVALRLNGPLAEGTMLLVWLGPMSGQESWLSLCVKHCHRESESWIVGGEFLGRDISALVT